MSTRAPGVRIVLQIVWSVSRTGAPLTPGAIERLEPYLTRYAQTLGVAVHAAGGTSDHLHLLAEIPPDVTLREIQRELQRASGRFLRDTLNLADFAWTEDGGFAGSIRPADIPSVAEYIREQEERHIRGDLDPDLEGETEPVPADDEPPAWLRDVLRGE